MKVNLLNSRVLAILVAYILLSGGPLFGMESQVKDTDFSQGTMGIFLSKPDVYVQLTNCFSKWLTPFCS